TGVQTCALPIYELPYGVGQYVDPVGHHSGAGRDRLGDLGGGEGDHRHGEVHRLQQGQSEGGPADGVDVDAAAGQLRVQVALGQLVGPAAVGGQSGVCGDALGAHAEHVEGRGVGERGQQVGAGGAAAPDRLVDHDGGPGQFAGPPGAGVDDAVFDDGGGGAAGVPHQPVEVGDVHEGGAGHVGGRVPGVGHVAVRGVVLQPDHGRAAAQPGVHQGEFVGALQDD